MKKIFMFLFLIFFMGFYPGGTLLYECANAAVDDAVNAAGAADGSTTITMISILCGVLRYLLGGVGRTLAAFVCAGTAMAFLAGKVSWTLVLTFTIGMGCIFGAPTIVKIFTGGSGDICNEGSGT